jgi:hypothetical protein
MNCLIRNAQTVVEMAVTMTGMIAVTVMELALITISKIVRNAG